MKIVDNAEGFWVDEDTGNKWNKLDFPNELDVVEKAVKMHGCTDCIDCVDCINCTDCIKCVSCTTCVQCVDCSHCTRCVNSYHCLDCSATNDSVNCKRIIVGQNLSSIVGLGVRRSKERTSMGIRILNYILRR